MKITFSIFLLSFVALACSQKTGPEKQRPPEYSEDAFEDLDEFLVEFQANFFAELKSAEEEEIFRGVHPEISKAKNRVLRIYETRPQVSGNLSWETLIREQISLGQELLELIDGIASDESISNAIRMRMRKFYQRGQASWEKTLDRYALKTKDRF